MCLSEQKEGRDSSIHSRLHLLQRCLVVFRLSGSISETESKATGFSVLTVFKHKVEKVIARKESFGVADLLPQIYIETNETFLPSGGAQLPVDCVNPCLPCTFEANQYFHRVPLNDNHSYS